ncbi:MAG: NAD-dependent epimerase/dehydratase family protein [Flavipsychrobacter sp.]
MVIGNGMIGQRFQTYLSDNDVLIFASGVSNSKSKNEEDYAREWQLLKKSVAEHKEKKIIYFSTCSVYDPTENQSLYVLHKKEIENYIASNCKKYIIFRVSNVVGKSKNLNTVLNFFVNHVRNGIDFNIWTRASRNLIDVDDLFKMVDYIIGEKKYENQIINIANPHNYDVPFIVRSIEVYLSRKANYSLVEKGENYPIDISMIVEIIEQLGLNFDSDYLSKLLHKYY